MQTTIKEYQLESVVQFLPRMPYHEALRELSNASVLLLLQASDDTVSLVPAKLYEYLRAQKPVLAVVYPGATQEIIEETNGGWSVDPRNDKGMSDSIRNIYRLWYDKALDVKIADRKVLSKYSRRELAGQLARVFDSVVNK